MKRIVSFLISLFILLTLCGGLASCTPKSPPSVSSDIPSDGNDENTADISEKWLLARVPDVSDRGESISKTGYAVSDKWISATVPGTVLTSYEYAGLIDDPYYGLNMAKLDQDYYNVDYWYRTEFTVSKEMSGRRVWLNFDGINHIADVYLNGKRLGSIEGAFIRGKFDVTDSIDAKGVNSLAVYIHWCDSQVEDMPSFLCSASWDWMPAIPGRNMGIYKPVYLTASGDVTLIDPFIKTDLPLPDVSTATADISVTVQNNANKESKGTLKGSIVRSDGSGKKYEFTKEVTLSAGETKEVGFDTVIMQNPDLWWPNGSGEQPLYTLSLEYVSGGAASDSVTTTFGVRELEYEYTEGDLTVIVNGRKILCKGGNWGIPDAMLKWTDEDFLDAIKMHADQNFNMIRCWHGTSDFDSFYKYCDEYGIMVYEDFWLNGWSRPRDIDMFMENVRDKIKRLRNHPCLVIWCGENENTPPAPLNRRIPEAIEELDGTRLYVAASNSGAVAGGVTYALQDPGWYFKHTVGFTTEIGTPTVPTADSMRRMMSEDDLWPIGNEVWDLHDWNFGIGNKIVETYQKAVNARYGDAKSIDDFCRKAQYLNYETYRAIFEAWNDTAFYKTTGILLWMSNPAWPSTIWQTYDYYKEGTGGYYGSKLACENVHIQWNTVTGDVKVVNTSGDDLKNAKAQVTVYNLDGSVKYDRTFGVDAPMTKATKVTTLLSSDGGVDLAAHKSAQASSTGEGYSPSLALDGDGGTRWAADGTGVQWFAVDLGDIKSIERVNIEWENAFSSGYEVQISLDNESWTTVKKVTNGDGGIDAAVFDPVDARYVRVYMTRAGTMWAYSIIEMQVIEAGSVPNSVADLSDTHFIKLRLLNENGDTVSENFYWRSISDTDYTATEKMMRADVDALIAASEENGVTTLTVTLSNKSSVCAVGLHIKLQKSFIYTGDPDARVLPAYYSDNYFSLTPNESRAVTVTFDTADLCGADLVIVLDGMNVPIKGVYLDSTPQN